MDTTSKVSWNANYIVLSYVFSFAGSYIAVCLSEQYRQSMINNPGIVGPNTLLWLMAVAVGGVAIWSMHFIGMGAIILKTTSNQLILVKFDLLITLISFLVGILFVYGGLLVATSDRVFIRNQKEFDEMILADASILSIKDARSKRGLKLLALFKGLKPIILGGIVAAGGICVMHYIGMKAQIFPVKMEWNPGIVVTSIIIAVVASIAAFWIMFRLLPIFPQSEVLKLASALIMGIAVCGMHYCGIYAAAYKESLTSTEVISVAVSSDIAVLSALTLGMILLVVIHIISYAELRSRNLRLLSITKRFSQVVVDLKNSPVNDSLASYMNKFENVLDDLDSSTFRRSSIVARSAVPQQRRSNGRKNSIVNSTSKQILSLKVSKTHSTVYAGGTPDPDGKAGGGGGGGGGANDIKIYDLENPDSDS